MAKTPKVKQKAGANSRSRAARRGGSPSLDLDKSVTDAPRASDATPVLSARPGGGIQKAKKKQKPMKRGQRARQEKGLARAEIVMDQLEKKKSESQVKMKKVRGRRAIWDEINGEAEEEKRKTPKLFSARGDDAEAEDQQWEDVDEQGDQEMKLVDGVQVPANAPVNKLVVVDRTASNAGSDLDDIS
ncbi:uncharacterized protein HMPREF1541_09887 [Cyphellophora europaea CBS 101466]|uniref:Alb1-domain-containing protein n=1 Tax=Cyphellophora europaea (strain CBS 101466) TaxID=1220924 RepID=W2S8H5_CYPE1|nr:uncharacterized protein HMPREF1541_09887 [Cyphellophora europaea CBS 101466]ETN45011.1 hypothetical protein HMPREF1541_09887 [Cyphellophora europaea CBS 101466]